MPVTSAHREQVSLDLAGQGVAAHLPAAQARLTCTCTSAAGSFAASTLTQSGTSCTSCQGPGTHSPP